MLAEPSSGADGPPAPVLATAIQPNSPPSPSVAAKNPASTNRSIAIVVDLSDDSAFVVRWAVQYYLRPGDAVVLLQVRPTSVLYGADWGSIPVSISGEAAAAGGGASEEELQKKREKDYGAFFSTKVNDLAQPLVDAQIPFNILVLKDHVCLEAQRLGLSAMILGRCTFRASGKGCKGMLGVISDYCVKHSVCPIVFAPYPDDAADGGGEATGAMNELHSVLEDQHVPKDAPEVQIDGEDTFLLTSSIVKPMEEFCGDKLIRCSKSYPRSEYHNCFTPSCPCNQHLHSPLQQLPGSQMPQASPMFNSIYENSCTCLAYPLASICR